MDSLPDNMQLARYEFDGNRVLVQSDPYHGEVNVFVNGMFQFTQFNSAIQTDRHPAYDLNAFACHAAVAAFDPERTDLSEWEVV